jgi:cation diffusion facilitator CzcD-associated flavoprotein CzcO
MEDTLQHGPTIDGRTFDVVVIGAGATGLYSLYVLKREGLSVVGIEEGDGVGGTWYWSRYPGCRLDSESYSYGYSFSEELLDEWKWSEHYASQTENERYFNYVADRFDLRSQIRFGTRVTVLEFDDDAEEWQLTTSRGDRLRAKFVVTAVGLLSAHYVPDFEGIDDFRGVWCHTGRWPREGLDLTRKRVGVVGTGATGVQIITAVASEVAELTVFQRTPNYTAPLRNRPITDEEQAHIRSSYPEIFALCQKTPTGFMHQPDPRSAMDVSAQERQEVFERLWAESGFKKWLSAFYDVMLPGPANDEYTAFIRGKIRERVADPALIEKLVPTSYPFGAKRPPCDGGYFEVFGRDNVHLVDVNENPILRITPTGILTVEQEYPLDVIVFATGYDAVTGPLTRMDIRGTDGLTIREKYAEGPRTYLGVLSVGFPNLFMLNSASVGNFVRAAEPLVDWVSDFITYMRQRGLSTVQPTPEAEQGWFEHAQEAAANMLRTRANSWNIGANIPGKPRVLGTPPDNAIVMRQRRADEAAHDYPGFAFTAKRAADAHSTSTPAEEVASA